jgi:arylsulfatase A-like enzyme
LRGLKEDLFEGGIRTPFIARWPGKVKPGTTSNFIGAFWDMLPTFCEMAGAAPGDTDGISILPTLTGNNAGQKQHAWLYWEYHSGGGRQAVRMGDWKAVRLNVKKDPQAPVQLFNLAADPAEGNDVAAQHPEIVATMRDIMSQRTPSPVAKWNF